jgi:hypothetical protein
MSYSTEKLKFLFELCFIDLGLLEKFSISAECLRNFIDKVEENYEQNLYHNFHHAFDVFQMMVRFLSSNEIREVLNSLDILSLLIATIGHDLSHPGTNNAFQVNTRSPLNLKYGDQAVLENHHAATCFEILEDPKCNILKALSQEEVLQVKQNIFDCIFATDMSQHQQYVDSFKKLFKSSGELGSAQIPQSKTILMQILTKAADVSNVTRPFRMARITTTKCTHEFWEQGDIETSMGMEVAPMFSRRLSAGKEAHFAHGFICNICEPFFEAVVDRIPSLSDLLVNLLHNKKCFATLSLGV